MSNKQPPLFPLRGVEPSYDFSLSKPGAKLSETWLQKEYEKLTIEHTRENRKRFRNVDLVDEDKDFLDSEDDMLLSDTDLSNTGQIFVHPPKRRLTSGIAPSAALVTSFQDNNPSNDSVTEATAPVIVAQPHTPNDAGHSNTPISDVDDVEEAEEQPQQLPLPSPSASPVDSTSKDDFMDQMETLLTTIPSTQNDLLAMIQNLTLFLNEKNQNHVIFRLLQNAKRSTLSSLHDTLGKNLKRDFLSNLPDEITYNILSHLDHTSIFNALLVSKSWHKIISTSDVWVHLLKRDKLMVDLKEIQDEIAHPEKLVKEWASPSSKINLAQLLYKKRYSIYRRWLDPHYEPKRISIRVPSQGNNVVTCLQHDDEKIVTGIDDKLINIYSPKTGALLKVLKGHENGVWALKYTGNTLVSGSTDRTVRIWNIKTGKCTHIFRGHTSTVRCLDILHPVKIGTDDTGKDIIFPKKPLLVTGSRDHNLTLWKLPLAPDDDEDEDDAMSDLSEDAITFDSNDTNNPYLLKVLVGHTQSVRCVSAYGNLIVSGSYDGTLRVWNLMNNGTCTKVLSGHRDRIYSTVLDFENKICYSGSMDSTIRVWNVETGDLLHTLEGHASLVGLLELSKDYLISAAADSTLRIWDPQTGDNLSKLEGHTAAITCFQHDALRIVSGSERMLKLWDIKTGKFIKDILADVTGGIWQVRFDFNRCVAAVQRSINDREETFIEILDYSTPPNACDD